MNNNQQVNGIILVRKDIGEADRLLLMYTKELGKIRVIAKGSRKIKSRLASHIEPFTIGQFQIVNGKTFYILTGAERKSYFNNQTDDLELYKEASYLCELVELSFHDEESNTKIFDELRDCLQLMADRTSPTRQFIISYFELKLLAELGYKPNFRVCKKCQKEIQEVDTYIGGFEGVVCPDCKHREHTISKNTLKILKLMQEKELCALLSINGIEGYEAELQGIIRPYLLDILPREPRSLEI
jgi:DNA repair protein RecO (recombination protein O)